MTRWIATQLGPHVPLHFTAFHPDYRMTDVARTPPATLQRARSIALANGLAYVYTGNVHDRAGGTTHCPGCGSAVIERDWHRILRYELDAAGRCAGCGASVPGRFGSFDPQAAFGARRIPVRLAVA
jgi:pyruvate formate lyase activating enzyme